MVIERAGRRMTLRQLMTHAEKLSRDLIQQGRATLSMRLSEFRDLSRPVRRRSGYPTLLAVQNALNHLQEAHDETKHFAEQLHEELLDIRERAKREQANRSGHG